MWRVKKIYNKNNEMILRGGSENEGNGNFDELLFSLQTSVLFVWKPYELRG